MPEHTVLDEEFRMQNVQPVELREQIRRRVRHHSQRIFRMIPLKRLERLVRFAELQVVHLPVAVLHRWNRGHRSSEGRNRSGTSGQQPGTDHQIPITRAAMPSASLQKAAEVCISSTTFRNALAKKSISRSSITSGGAAFSTMKLLPQICVRKP